MASTGIEPSSGVIGSDATADLQSSRPGGESLVRSFVVTWAKTNHVTTHECIAAIRFSIPSGAFFRDEIFARSGPIIAQGAADDLFYLTVMKVDAWAKFCHGVGQENHYHKASSRTK